MRAGEQPAARGVLRGARALGPRSPHMFPMTNQMRLMASSVLRIVLSEVMRARRARRGMPLASSSRRRLRITSVAKLILAAEIAAHHRQRAWSAPEHTEPPVYGSSGKITAAARTCGVLTTTCSSTTRRGPERLLMKRRQAERRGGASRGNGSPAASAGAAINRGSSFPPLGLRLKSSMP